MLRLVVGLGVVNKCHGPGLMGLELCVDLLNELWSDLVGI